MINKLVATLRLRAAAIQSMAERPSYGIFRLQLPRAPASPTRYKAAPKRSFDMSVWVKPVVSGTPVLVPANDNALAIVHSA
jgi:hypothetical protein